MTPLGGNADGMFWCCGLKLSKYFKTNDKIQGVFPCLSLVAMFNYEVILAATLSTGPREKQSTASPQANLQGPDLCQHDPLLTGEEGLLPGGSGC